MGNMILGTDSSDFWIEKKHFKFKNFFRRFFGMFKNESLYEFNYLHLRPYLKFTTSGGYQSYGDNPLNKNTLFDPTEIYTNVPLINTPDDWSVIYHRHKKYGESLSGDNDINRNLYHEIKEYCEKILLCDLECEDSYKGVSRNHFTIVPNKQYHREQALKEALE